MLKMRTLFISVTCLIEAICVEVLTKNAKNLEALHLRGLHGFANLREIKVLAKITVCKKIIFHYLGSGHNLWVGGVASFSKIARTRISPPPLTARTKILPPPRCPRTRISPPPGQSYNNVHNGTT